MESPIKISILCPIHRWGGLDMLFAGLEHQIFPKTDYELILCDKLYETRNELVSRWAEENSINIVHFKPKNQSNYHVHSSVLNECLKRAMGEYSIVIGDYSYFDPNWIDIHYQYNKGGYCLSAPQMIYGLPKLCSNLEQPFSTFYEEFSTEMFKLLPHFAMDRKLNLPNGALIDFQGWYNRNESFPTVKAREIGGWDEGYNNRVGPSNLEFGLRMQYKSECKIACDSRATIHRIMSYPISPHTEFLDSELDSIVNTNKYNILCKKYGIKI